ncbi:hypothetical protein C943_01783 [Mariniradius saccharolyticus AK6]|uniref:Uncharacterized protein n=1 Tax=Mariniradius saccharolyticus AK6 TaxID=1239962 RepID=M7XAA7_9BACT|nr:hypothetical protein C943_01783 [Mariniradius saccharolyticus AK6]
MIPKVRGMRWSLAKDRENPGFQAALGLGLGSFFFLKVFVLGVSEAIEHQLTYLFL